MVNKKYYLVITPIAVIATLAIVAIVFATAGITTTIQAQTAAAQTTTNQNTNFAQLLEQKPGGHRGPIFNASIEYESPKTVVLNGPVHAITVGPRDYCWLIDVSRVATGSDTRRTIGQYVLVAICRYNQRLWLYN